MSHSTTGGSPIPGDSRPSASGTEVEVWVVEDNDLLRDSYAQVVNRAAGMRCPHAFSTCEQALASIEAGGAPDIVLMDIGLPGMDGIEGVRRVRALSPESRVVMLTVHDDRENVFRALCAGASGYVLKPDSSAKVVDAIGQIRDGEVPMSAQIARKVLDIFRRWSHPGHDYGLTKREVEVLELLVEGYSLKRVAKQLQLSHHTANTHIRNIYAKLHVHSRSSAVAKALKERLI